MGCLGDNTASEFVAGRISKADRASLEEHIADCRDCRQLVAMLAKSDTVATQAETQPSQAIAEIDIQPGTKVGRFSILGACGKGGMGVVFSAYDPHLERKVAIKFVRCLRSNKRLVREARAIAHLSHPNIVIAYDVGLHRDLVYIAMEFVDGSTLGEWRQDWKPGRAEVLQRYQQAGHALSAAHKCGVLHLDFKPDNVLLGQDGRVKVSDFGLASNTRVPDEQGITGPAIVGTPRYMAPEQRDGMKPDPRTDQFSFCVTLYEALWDRHPFQDQESGKRGDVVQPPVFKDRLDKRLWRILRRGLQTDRKSRYPSMDLLLRDLLQLSKPKAARKLGRAAVIGATLVASTAFAATAYFRLDEARQDNEAKSAALAERTQRLHAAQQTIEELGNLVTTSSEESRRLSRQVAQLSAVIAAQQESTDTSKIVDETVKPEAVTPTPRQHDATIAEQPSLAQLVERELASRGQTSVTRDSQDPETTLALPQDIQSDPAFRRLMGSPFRNKRSVRTALSKTLERSIKANNIDIGYCVEEWQSRVPNKELDLTLGLELSASGSLTYASPLGQADLILSECVQSTLKRVDFPRSSKRVLARADFGPGGDGKVLVAVHELKPR